MKLKSLALAVALAVSLPAQATVVSNFLTFDGGSGVGAFPPVQAGGEDKLQDDSLSRLIDTGTPGISIGDQIFGILTLSEILSSGQPSKAVGLASQISFLYAGTYAAGPGGTLTIVANSALLASLCGTVCAGAGILPTSVAVLLSTTQPETNPVNDPLNWNAEGANGISANFNGANGNGPWTWEATMGLTAGQQNFFAFTGDAILGGTYRAGFDITSNAFGATWLPVDVLDFQVGTHLVDISLDVAITQSASANEQLNGWTFRDQSTFYVNPVAVPNPGSLALMGLGLGVLGWAARRKK